MPDFKVGDQVKCIDGTRYYQHGPKKDKVYTVQGIRSTKDFDVLFFKEIDAGWYPKRFVLFKEKPYSNFLDKLKSLTNEFSNT